MQANRSHYCEAGATVELGSGFFRADSRPARDFGVLLLRWLGHGAAPSQPLTVLDGLAGCGIRSLRYGLEARATAVWANDADPDRLPLLQKNLAPLGAQGVSLHCTALTIQKLLAQLLLEERRFDLVDLDGFGAATALVPAALEAVRFGGILYLASTDGRSFTGHDRAAAVRRLGAAVRAQPCSWELALRLQLGAIARAAWSLGRGVEPLLSFSEGRTFRTAVRVTRQPAAAEELQLGLQAYCHRCGNHWGQPLLRWKGLGDCSCGAAPVLSGPLWRGPLQAPALLLEAQALEDPQRPLLAPAAQGLWRRLGADAGLPSEPLALADLGRQLGGGPPPLTALLAALRQAGWQASASGVQPQQFRCDAPWPELVAIGAGLRRQPGDR